MPKQTGLLDALRVEPGTRVRLEKRDPGATLGHDKTTALAATEVQLVRLRDLQDRLWAESKHSVLVVLQGIDAAGKDGTIAKVMEAFNPQGCPVTSFKVPSGGGARPRFPVADPQADAGKRARSPSSTARTTRTSWSSASTASCPGAVWSKRYDQINEFERMLTEDGTTIVKFFLTIDRDEQRQRFQERYDDPNKRWKFKLADLEERKLWDDYQAAFDEALSRSSDGVGAVVRHPGQPELVPQSRGRDDHSPFVPTTSSRLSPARQPAQNLMGNYRGRPALPAPQRLLPPPNRVPKTPRTRSCPSREVTTLPPVRIAVSIVRWRARSAWRWAVASAFRWRSATRWAAAISLAWRLISRCCWAGVIVFRPVAVVGATLARTAATRPPPARARPVRAVMRS